MKLPTIPIQNTGWFYLWLGLMLFGFYAHNASYLITLESYSLKLWQTFDQKAPSQSKQAVVSISDFNLTNHSMLQIVELAQKYPSSILVVASQDFAKLSQFLSDPEYQGVAKRIILRGKQRENTLPSLSKSTSFLSTLFSFDFFNPIITSNLASSTKQLPYLVAWQPVTNNFSSILVWRNNSDYFPTLTTQAIMSYQALLDNNKRPIETKISLSFNHLLAISDKKQNLGFYGDIIPYQSPLQQKNINWLLSNPSEQQTKIFLIDDQSFDDAMVIERVIDSLINNHYLYRSGTSIISQYLLLIITLLLIFKMKKLSILKQLVAFSSLVALQFLLQGYFVSQSLWLSISLSLILMLVSWILQLGYSREQNYFFLQNKKHNQLLEETLQIFYNSQNFETVLPYLEQSIPNESLVKGIYEVAIQAEAHKNILLAKKLHQLILNCQPKYSASLDRISEFESNNQATELDQTLVINPDSPTVTITGNNVLNIENFGRYQVEAILGKGAMGIVFQGVDPKINRHVAIKTLQLSHDLDSEGLAETKKRFFKEAETAGNLSHANIVTIYDVGEENQPNSNQSLAYIAMDLLSGAPLSEYIKKGKLLPPSLVYQLMIQMTDALDYAHKNNVIHRDIKPANIIYNDEFQRGTLTDFGIAHIVDHSKTKTGTIIGSPYYMSPEQILGSKVDGRSDIFSLGVTFYQLLTGQLPFTGESIASVAFHITKTKHDSVKTWNKKLASSATRITNKALQKDPNKRYQTMQEFKQTLIKSLKNDYKKSPLS